PGLAGAIVVKAHLVGALTRRQDRWPESYPRSLRYFNLYRLLVAALFLTMVAGYDIVPVVGDFPPERFVEICVAYLLLAFVLFAIPERMQLRFNWLLTVGVMVDIAC